MNAYKNANFVFRKIMVRKKAKVSISNREPGPIPKPLALYSRPSPCGTLRLACKEGCQSIWKSFFFLQELLLQRYCFVCGDMAENITLECDVRKA
jgi:hypothetical protein